MISLIVVVVVVGSTHRYYTGHPPHPTAQERVNNPFKQINKTTRRNSTAQ